MKLMTVKDCFRQIMPDLDLVKSQARLSEVFKIFKRHTVSRTVFVVDAAGKLLGLIDIRTLLKIFASSLVKQESLTFFSEVSARTAEDVMVRPISLRENDSLEKALQIMVESKTEDLPVVDSAGKVVGSLNCLDVLGKLV